MNDFKPVLYQIIKQAFLCLLIVSNTVFESESLADTNKRSVTKVFHGPGVIWSIAFIDANRIIFTLRTGKVGIVDISKNEVRYTSFQARVFARDQGGLLDVKPAINYAKTNLVYFTYSKPVKDGVATTLARAKVLNNQITDWKDLLVTKSASDSGQHYGSRIAFDNEGYVYFGIGDRGDRDNSQDLSNHAGTIIRLHADGRFPTDNPFYTNSTIAPGIWSYGHRNPQGMAFDSTGNQLWSIEHGPRGGDEINLIKPGRNYGWPVVSHGKEYWAPLSIGEGTEKEGMENPVKVYIPSIAPGSLLFYNGDRYNGWKGNLFAGALKLQHLNRIILNQNNEAIGEERLFKDLRKRIRGLTQSPDGLIYFSTDDGAIYRIEPDN